MALGAGRDSVIRMILGEGALLAMIGSLFGLVGAYFVGRALHSTFYGIGKVDFTAFTAVAAVLLATALVACFMPARRAASVDPMRALRTE